MTPWIGPSSFLPLWRKIKLSNSCHTDHSPRLEPNHNDKCNSSTSTCVNRGDIGHWSRNLEVMLVIERFKWIPLSMYVTVNCRVCLHVLVQIHCNNSVLLVISLGSTCRWSRRGTVIWYYVIHVKKSNPVEISFKKKKEKPGVKGTEREPSLPCLPSFSPVLMGIIWRCKLVHLDASQTRCQFIRRE